MSIIGKSESKFGRSKVNFGKDSTEQLFVVITPAIEKLESKH